jgi:hypothetical protein
VAFLPLLFLMLLLFGVWMYFQRFDSLVKKLGGSRHFPVGKYMVGLEDCDNPTLDVECVITANDLVFVKRSGKVLGRVPRRAIFEVLVDDKSQITQRLTATRLITMGAFAFAAPKAKKIKEWCVAIAWNDTKGMRRATLFEFTGPKCEGYANRAANAILSSVDRPQQQDDAKQCPYCAETIKAAATICRFCNRTLVTS